MFKSSQCCDADNLSIRQHTIICAESSIWLHNTRIELPSTMYSTKLRWAGVGILESLQDRIWPPSAAHPLQPSDKWLLPRLLLHSLPDTRKWHGLDPVRHQWSLHSKCVWGLVLQQVQQHTPQGLRWRLPLQPNLPRHARHDGKRSYWKPFQPLSCSCSLRYHLQSGVTHLKSWACWTVKVCRRRKLA